MNSTVPQQGHGQWSGSLPYYQQQPYSAPPPAQQYPFSHLCPPGSSLITLKICDKGSHMDYLLAPGATPFQPTYSIHYGEKKKKVQIDFHIQQNTNSGREAAILNVPESATTEPVELKFGWETWSCNFMPEAEWGDDWLSDVGTLEGHTLCWRDLGTYKDDGYVLRCFDTDEAYADVCSVVISHSMSGQIEIPVHLIRDQNGLDEMVGVAYAALQQRREQIEAWVPGDASSSSSSSSSDDEEQTQKKPSKRNRLLNKLKG